MIKISNSKFILIFTKLLILLVVAKLIAFAVWWILPSDGVELSVRENYQPKYQRVNFNMMLDTNEKVQRKSSAILDSTNNISNMILKGLYGKDKDGFVIISLKSNPNKTTIIEVGESFDGYELKSILHRSAKFSKNGLGFTLSLQKIKALESIQKAQDISSTIAIDEPVIVSKQDINYYAKNPNDIWKDISIKELREGSEIKGFKVTRVNINSKFADMGIQKNDIIIKANNVKLTSYKNAIDIYQSIDKLEMIQIVVIRDSQEVELMYEIK